MKKYKVPDYKDFYNQFITLNKTNEQLANYYNVSQSVIHTWKKLYNLKKDIGLIVKSYKHNGCFMKGHKTWNKGMKGLITGEGCKKTWYTSEQMLERAKKSIGKPRFSKDTYTCLTEELIEKRNTKNNKVYKHHKRMGYARWLLLQQGIDIPKGYIVYHKDGDIANNDIGNLEIISRAELLKRNTK